MICKKIFFRDKVTVKNVKIINGLLRSSEIKSNKYASKLKHVLQR